MGRGERLLSECDMTSLACAQAHRSSDLTPAWSAHWGTESLGYGFFGGRFTPNLIFLNLPNDGPNQLIEEIFDHIAN